MLECFLCSNAFLGVVDEDSTEEVQELAVEVGVRRDDLLRNVLVWVYMKLTWTSTDVEMLHGLDKLSR